MHGSKNEELNNHVHDNLLNHLGKNCILETGRGNLKREAPASLT